MHTAFQYVSSPSKSVISGKGEPRQKEKERKEVEKGKEKERYLDSNS